MEAPAMHRAFRADLAVCAGGPSAREPPATRRSVIPYTGYGSTTWLRILGRVLLARAARLDAGG